MTTSRQGLILRKSTGQILRDGQVIGQRCGQCAATGRFITGVHNGVPTGPGGACFRCAGKGYQTPQDERRNQAYDSYSAARAIRADLAR